ncbi:D-glycero-alpha-D-manno-heptose-1,7-bisphosphate 7-phosphatase [Adhaeribacter pallidiroseus]|uniref:D,D-heptose 1,7-bisphosphate phosphatase n=1 Tax=Adhaeribacter pallidiroseus TaxID=2072847 RepID=A0A369QGF6_9BACT|nr:HAD-IIIA family hydrolase [Adhaeribacter pallidiroseus]RDC63370.1 D-glycero-beta-D-manno-heptose 1,7-bisphosphate 7-phosphatase [Adhaeribacter pallidiroseus]
MTKHKAVFLDRDGVLNVERGDYTYLPEDFVLEYKVPEAVALLKQNNFLLIVVTNQGGLAKKLFTRAQMLACHSKLQQNCNNLIDAIYYAPAHPSVSASLARKPDSLMLEKALAKFNINPEASWLVGDQLRDMHAAEKVQVKGILVGPHPPGTYIMQVTNLWEATQIILNQA